MIRRFLALLCVSLAFSATARDSGIAEANLPPEARETLRLIDRGGPFPYHRDGATFQNRERRLPEQSPGYYREYTVPTPDRNDRGAHRIVAGDKPPAVFYYSADHYETFLRIQR
jgi:guanyl-specific ribonuclease Sa